MNKCKWSLRVRALYLQYTEDNVLQFLYKKKGQYLIVVLWTKPVSTIEACARICDREVRNATCETAKIIAGRCAEAIRRLAD